MRTRWARTRLTAVVLALGMTAVPWAASAQPGVFPTRPITFVVPDGSLLSATAPKPVAGYTETILRLIGVVFGALAQADPARAMAAPFGTINALSLAGHRADGSRWVMFTFFGAMGSFVIGAVSEYVVGDPAKLWEALLIVAAVFMPVATFFMWRAIGPYGREVERLEALGR